MPQIDFAAEIRSTGCYFNTSTHSYQCWAVNQSTGEKKLLGECTAFAVESSPEVLKAWEHEVWTRFLEELKNAPN